MNIDDVIGSLRENILKLQVMAEGHRSQLELVHDQIGTLRESIRDARLDIEELYDLVSRETEQNADHA